MAGSLQKQLQQLSIAEPATKKAAPTTAQSPPPAGARAAAIPELLEKIFLELDLSTVTGITTLLLSQRINKTFQDTIASTPSLQRALRFGSALPRTTSEKPELSPLFQDAWHFAIGDEWGSMLSIDLDFDGAKETEDGMAGIKVVVRRTGKKWAGKKGAVPRNQSWRRMHLFEVTGMLVGEIVSRGRVFKRVEVEIENPTLGEVFDLVYEV